MAMKPPAAAHGPQPAIEDAQPRLEAAAVPIEEGFTLEEARKALGVVARTIAKGQLRFDFGR
jgi:hypothetical protein